VFVDTGLRAGSVGWQGFRTTEDGQEGIYDAVASFEGPELDEPHGTSR